MFLNNELMSSMLKVSRDLAERSVKECGSRYGFDSEEACAWLGLSEVEIKLKSKDKKLKVSKSKDKTESYAFPLPYNGELKVNCCEALRHNSGLYTQCHVIREDSESYCKSCRNQMQKKGLDEPEYGTIHDRLAVGILEYVDKKGRKPTSYLKIMKKLNLTEESVLEEAVKHNINISREHFSYMEESKKRGRPSSNKEVKVKGAKGRPKKTENILVIDGDENDLFDKLVADAAIDGEINEEKEKENEEDKEKKEAEKKKKAEEDKEKKEAEKKKKAEEDKEKKEAEKKKKEEEKKKKAEEDKEKKEAEKKKKEEAKEAEKKAKEAAKEAEKKAKEAAKEAKEAEKKAKEAGKKKKVEPVEESKGDCVKKITFENKHYLQSKSTGVIYDYNEYIKNGEQVIVGQWSVELNKVVFAGEKVEIVEEKVEEVAEKVEEVAEKVEEKIEEKVEVEITEKKVEEVAEKVEEKVEEEKEEIIKKIKFDGKKYLRSETTGIVYDYEEYTKNDEQVIVGKWCSESNRIIFKQVEYDSDEDDEEEEEEYDE
jgi:hypothetical protein